MQISTHHTTNKLEHLIVRGPLPPLAQVAIHVAYVAATWGQRRRTRLALAKLDEALLDDVGLSTADAKAEFTKPFWRV